MNKMMLAALSAVCVGMGGASVAQAANTKVCFEAESAGAVTSPVKKVMSSNSQWSGKGFVEIPWDKNVTKGLGSATISFKAPKAGVYYLWARTFWANGCGNSIGAILNGGSESQLKVLGEDGTYDKWHWVGGKAKVALKAGQNVLKIKNTETGVRVDQFFLCTDPNYTPVGKRPSTQ